MQDETYNGWKNYPTWAVNLWLSNDEPLYRETLDRVEHSIDIWRRDDRTIDESPRYEAADMLRDWVTDELAPDLGASFAADLLGYALGEVDWHEIADSWIELVKDQNEVTV